MIFFSSFLLLLKEKRHMAQSVQAIPRFFYSSNGMVDITSVKNFHPLTPEIIFSFDSATMNAFIQICKIAASTNPKTDLIYLMDMNKMLSTNTANTTGNSIGMLSMDAYSGFLHLENSLNNNNNSIGIQQLVSEMQIPRIDTWRMPKETRYLYQQLDSNPETLRRLAPDKPLDMKTAIVNSLGLADHVEISESILQTMYSRINLYVFFNRLDVLLQLANKKLILKLSNKLTSSGGNCKQKADSFIIKVSSNHCLLSNDKTYKSGGTICHGKWDSLYTTIGHELIHVLVDLIIFLKLNLEKIVTQIDVRYETHGTLFRELAFAFFGQTDITHSLFHKNTDNPIISNTNHANAPARDINKTVSREYVKTKMDFTLGMRVSFNVGKNKKLVTGNIIKLNPKMAIVQLTTGEQYCVRYRALIST
jgi:hypothetical protein